jgi:hypothetical protein
VIVFAQETNGTIIYSFGFYFGKNIPFIPTSSWQDGEREPEVEEKCGMGSCSTFIPTIAPSLITL